ncbi:LysR family transcriptional regulator [Streptomyces flaveolus]|uniref:LysR family transcriptional regulator n=1 Tax=Streptomyces flaveolus TaxID=67297 RepID=UPI0036F9DD59
MDLDAIRTFIAVAEAGQFQAAADDLTITQQGASRRVASLERELGVKLFARVARGVRLTESGRALLPHALDMVRVAERARAAVASGPRPLRVDVVGRRITPSNILQDFYREHRGITLEVVTLANADTASALVEISDGSLDATFRSLRASARILPSELRSSRVIDERHELLVGPQHPLAHAKEVSLAKLSQHVIWMPGMADPEPIGYYEDLAQAFGLTIDTKGPSFGVEALLTELAGSDHLATLIGEGSRYLWPESYNLCRIPIVHPAPVYPLSVIWRADNPHPVLTAFLEYLYARYQTTNHDDVWTPTWAQ